LQFGVAAHQKEQAASFRHMVSTQLPSSLPHHVIKKIVKDADSCY